jgi:hypothetical protein
MINASRVSDKKHDRYYPLTFIDRPFIESLFDENPDLICPYCNLTMNDQLVTIERVNNSIGHIKENCILACLKCNRERVGQQKPVCLGTLADFLKDQAYEYTILNVETGKVYGIQKGSGLANGVEDTLKDLKPMK